MHLSLVKPSFFNENDVVSLAKKLIGKLLYSEINGFITSGIIVETEAYSGRADLASHAARGETNRNKIMYKGGGHAYIYLCYGIHHLFNIVANQEGFPDAVLIRAISPLEGVEVMKQRRQLTKANYELTSGPGKLAQAMGIDLRHNQVVLKPGNGIWLEDDQSLSDDIIIHCSPRIGIAYAKEDAKLPWRFYIAQNPWVSKGKTINF